MREVWATVHLMGELGQHFSWPVNCKGDAILTAIQTPCIIHQTEGKDPKDST